MNEIIEMINNPSASVVMITFGTVWTVFISGIMLSKPKPKYNKNFYKHY